MRIRIRVTAAMTLIAVVFSIIGAVGALLPLSEVPVWGVCLVAVGTGALVAHLTLPVIELAESARQAARTGQASLGSR